MSRYAYCVDIFESGKQPVVRHVFYGSTEAEATAVYKAHLRADNFLRSCVMGMRFKDLPCRARGRMYKIV